MTKALVVDDMAICREPVAEALRMHDYSVACASSGEEALSRLCEDRPDVVLLDVTMPGLDGLSVLRAIRRNPETKSLPVILLTDKADKACVQDAARIGVQGYLLKSQFSLPELLSRVESSLAATTAAATELAPGSDVIAPKAQSAFARLREQERARAAPAPVGASAKPKRVSPSTDKPMNAVSSSGRGSSPSSHVPSASSLHALQPIMLEKELLALVKGGLELKPLGATIQNVIAVTSNARCSADDVAKAVSQDQALSIRVLKLANSSAFSRGHPLGSVKDAVQRVGVQEVRTMVLALGVVEQYGKAVTEHLDQRLFWEHSIACGLVAAGIAKARHAKNADAYFLWGMTHDVGRLILLEHAADACGSVWDAARDLDVPLEVVEARLFSMDHCGILRHALEQWRFPREFIAPVVSHHLPVSRIRQLGGDESESAAIIALSNRVAHALLLGNSGNAVLYPLDDLMEFLDLSPSILDQVVSRVTDETKDLKYAMLARGHEEAWPDFAANVRGELGLTGPILSVSAHPETDAFRLFARSASPPASEGPPQFALVDLGDSVDGTAVLARLEAEERAAGAERLPIVIIRSAGAPALIEQSLETRPRAFLSTPVRIPKLIREMRTLLAATA